MGTNRVYHNLRYAIVMFGYADAVSLKCRDGLGGLSLLAMERLRYAIRRFLLLPSIYHDGAMLS